MRERLATERGRVAELEAQKASAAELAEAFGTLGAHYHAYQFLESAGACYANARELAPGEFRWAYYLGRVSLASGRLEAATLSLGQAVELRPEEAPAHLALGQALQAASRREEARKAFEAALARDPRSIEALFLLGQIEAEAGELPAAIRHMEQALALQADAGPIERSLAGLLARAGDRVRAAELAQRGSKAAVRSRDPWMQQVTDLASAGRSFVDRGVVAFTEGRFEDAAAAFGQAVAALPDDAEAHLNLGSALYRLERLDEAEASYRRALELDPERVLAYFNLGTLLARRGLRDEAHEQYRQALARDPKHLEARFNLANSSLTLGDFEAAEADFRLVVELAPGHSAARLGLSVALIRLGRSAEARVVLEEGLAGRPDDALLLHGLSRLLAASPETAVRDGARALALARRLVASAKQLDYVVALAMAEAEAGHFAEAVSWQRQALAAVSKSGRRDLLRPLERNLALYEAGKPCRVPWTGADFAGRWQ